MTLIGLVGTKGVGKDTVGDYLTGYTKRAFATSIKQACAILFDLSPHIFEGDDKELCDKRHGMSPRQMLQLVGTDFFRDKVDADFWIHHFKHWYSQHVSDNIVVTDLRFQNEVDAIKALGGIVVRITRSHETGGRHTLADTHVTKQGVATLQGVDYYVANDSTLEHLYAQIDKILADIADI
jgi:hypothetical protein